MKRLIGTAAVLAILALVGGIACGKKTSRVAVTPHAGSPFSDGIWYGTFTISVVSGEAACSQYAGSFVDSFAVTAGVPLDLITGLCDFVTVGNQFTQVCHDTLENSATCLLVQTLTGSGTVTGNYFSGTWTLTYQKTGSCLAWEPVPNCTFRIVGNGTKVPGTGPVLTYRSLPEALTRLMRRRFVADP